jgi:hypothetical protein
MCGPMPYLLYDSLLHSSKNCSHGQLYFQQVFSAVPTNNIHVYSVVYTLQLGSGQWSDGKPVEADVWTNALSIIRLAITQQ